MRHSLPLVENSKLKCRWRSESKDGIRAAGELVRVSHTRRVPSSLFRGCVDTAQYCPSGDKRYQERMSSTGMDARGRTGSTDQTAAQSVSQTVTATNQVPRGDVGSRRMTGPLC